MSVFGLVEFMSVYGLVEFKETQMKGEVLRMIPNRCDIFRMATGNKHSESLTMHATHSEWAQNACECSKWTLHACKVFRMDSDRW
jgi:hypothetical protein